MNFNLACRVHRHGGATPHALAVACDARSLTYGELAEQAMRVAACLQRSPTWKRPDGAPPRVGILASRGIDACVAVAAAAWAGATYVPIGPKLPPERVLALMSMCGLSALIADEVGATLLDDRVLAACPPLVLVPTAPAGSHGSRLVGIDSLPAVPTSEPACMDAHDTAYIIFTSGSTGVPKGVMTPAGAIHHYIGVITELLGLRTSDRVLEPCELGFDFSAHNMYATWQAGASLHVLPANRVMNAVRFARAERLTVWNSVPSLVGMLRQVKALGEGALPDLRVTVLGGEQLPEPIVAAWRLAAPNSVIHNIYGPTETTVCCLKQIVGHPTPLTPGRDSVAIGTPLPGNEVAVLGANGEALPDGTPGELAVSGVQLASGYLDAPELSAARFPVLRGKRWYLTGDLAVRDGDGVFHWLGRIDNQVKVRGHRIELEEVDAHLRRAAQADFVGTVAWPFSEGSAQGLVSFVGEKCIDAPHLLLAEGGA
jgi:D-alanine--poly(phosphoribitol) ligase subunit 1